jgi:hypothetical protein
VVVAFTLLEALLGVGLHGQQGSAERLACFEREAKSEAARDGEADSSSGERNDTKLQSGAQVSFRRVRGLLSCSQGAGFGPRASVYVFWTPEALYSQAKRLPERQEMSLAEVVRPGISST